jgi:SAM-dependent methyltransferase
MRMTEQSCALSSSGRLTSLLHADGYERDQRGIYRPPFRIQHREEDYPTEGFHALQAMQRDHFWYRGRHRFILHFTRQIAQQSADELDGVDLGGGCGGWIRYLHDHHRGWFRHLALADSSTTALELAARCIPSEVNRYQIDLLNLGWAQRWDVAFLLDVLEHITDDERALREIRSALRPGGLLIVTTPALERLRTPIDDMSHHVRRYSRGDLGRLASATGFELVTSRYFMFFLSPLLLLSRWSLPDPATLTSDHVREHLTRSARTPPPLLNRILTIVLNLETPLGAWIPFPWGTSVLGVFRRPVNS